MSEDDRERAMHEVMTQVKPLMRRVMMGRRWGKSVNLEAATRVPPARVLRIRVHTDRVDGPIWLSLLAQCAWLRGGIIGDAIAP